VSVDPERDTPERLARFVTAFNERFVGVTGPLEDVEAVTERYAVSFFREPPEDPEGNPDGYTIAHTSTVFLIDPQGRMRAGFMGFFAPEEVTHDVGLVLAEAG
jgi:protein SCO1/2